MSPEDRHSLELSIAELRSTVTEGFTAVRGDINLLARGESETTKDVADLTVRVKALESRSFPLPVIGGLCGVAAVLLTVMQVLGKG